MIYRCVDSILCAALAVLGRAPVSAQSGFIGPLAPPAATATPVPVKTIRPINYDLRGIFDPEFNNVLAAAVKVPQGWRLAQSFTREWRGTIPVSKVYIGMSSPDGHDSIEFLPCMMYHYEDGPTAHQLRQFGEQRGQRDPTLLPPMTPVKYLKKVYLPLLAANARFTPSITEAKEGPPQQADNPFREG